MRISIIICVASLLYVVCIDVDKGNLGILLELIIVNELTNLGGFIELAPGENRVSTSSLSGRCWLIV